jgi:hypothetical protein
MVAKFSQFGLAGFSAKQLFVLVTKIGAGKVVDIAPLLAVASELRDRRFLITEDWILRLAASAIPDGTVWLEKYA